LKRYLGTFPNLILTNFYEFRLYQHGEFVSSVTIAMAVNAINLEKTPPLQNALDLQHYLIAISLFPASHLRSPQPCQSSGKAHQLPA
jgi:hypothetical protein